MEDQSIRKTRKA